MYPFEIFLSIISGSHDWKNSLWMCSGSLEILFNISISFFIQATNLIIVNKDNIFVLGKSRSEAIAKEGALKIKELSYIHSEGYSGNSLKHGPFALLNENFPVILISPNDSYYTSMLNAYHEIESRNAPILFITTNQECIINNSIILPNNEIFGDLLCVIPMQLIAYYLAIDKGYNCDFPRNLAKVCTTA